MLIFFTKVALAAGLLATFGLVLRFRSRFDTFFADKGVGWLGLLWVALRLVPFLIVYLVVGFKATSDLIGFYNGAVSASQGAVPYRDFVSVYAPFFCYITAIPIQLWHDARAIIVFMMVMEGLILWGTYRLYRLSLTTVLLYLLLPATLMFSVLGGQEDVWMWGFALLTVPLLRRNHTLAAGVVLGLALVATKALFVVFVPTIFFWVNRRFRLAIGTLAVGVPVLVWIYSVGEWAFLMPMQLTQDPLAPNIRSVLHPFLGDLLDQLPLKLYNYAALLAICLISTVLMLRWKEAQISYHSMVVRAWVLVYALIMLLVPSAYAVYAFGFMLPLVAGGLSQWQRGRPLAVLLVFNFLAVIQPTAWWRMGARTYVLTDLASPQFLLEYLMQLGIVASLVYFVVALWPVAVTVPADRPTSGSRSGSLIGASN